jgi:hypothetical protein
MGTDHDDQNPHHPTKSPIEENTANDLHIPDRRSRAATSNPRCSFRGSSRRAKLLVRLRPGRGGCGVMGFRIRKTDKRHHPRLSGAPTELSEILSDD